ncbi:MAG: TonB-dependent receptor [Gammaproteobacteria bacterium]|nr:TonB-dependent receptor [Gammaproteobacteria bacterium]
MSKFLLKTGLAGALSTASLLMLSPALYAQDAGSLEEVVVTGFRGSLEAGLSNKREAVNSKESIVAEDIGKMPDLNLAESLQRVPGIAITREGGEGRQITVRGLGPDFTRTTLNGMEVPASGGGIDSSGGVNRSRALDFNIFASELFNRIDVNKSQMASIEEGGLASTIEMYTAKPFDNPGLHFNAGVQLTADNLANETDPRITALYSQTFADDTVGVLLSAAVSQRTVRQEGFGSVRFSAPILQGDDWADTTGTVVTGTPNTAAFAQNFSIYDPADDPLSYLFTPRLPRMDYFSNTVDRIGITAAVQFRPTDNLEFGLDIASSKLENDRISYNYAAQFRNSWDSITPVSLTLDPTGQYIIAGSFTDVRPRSESRGQFSTTDFTQIVATGKYDFSDTISLEVMYGTAKSEHDEEQDRYNIDGPIGGADFSFDMTGNSNMAAMTYGFDILDTSNYTIGGGLTVRRDLVERTNDTFKADLNIDLDPFNIKTGFIANTREVDSARINPVGLTAPAGDSPVDNYAGLAVTFQSQVGGGFASALDAPAGFPTNWMVEDISVANELYGVNTATWVRAETDGSTFNVKEETSGIYVQGDWRTEVGNMPLLLNAGVRYVETDTTASGVSNIAGELINTVASNSYTDTLPSVNATLEMTDELLLRLNLGENITRPALSSLVPRITSITPVNGNIGVGNPDLNPIRSDSIDLSIEWYFAEESLLAFTYFKKDITGFIASDTVLGTLNPGIAAVVAQRPEYDPGDPAYLPGAIDPYTGIWNLSQPINSQNFDLDGYEILYQQPFSSLPGFWSNFGIIFNFTHVNAEAPFDTSLGVVVSNLPDLSEESYNYTLYYETDVWGARVSVNNRDDYLTRVSGSNGNAQEANTGPTRMDLSAFYNLNDSITFSLEVINLNEEAERNYTTGPGASNLNLVREYNSTGREVFLGMRYSY